MARVVIILFIVLILVLVIILLLSYIDYRNKKHDYELKKLKEKESKD